MSYLETIYKEIDEDDSYAGRLHQHVEGINDPDRSKLIIEVKCFEFMLRDGKLAPIFESGDFKRTNIDLITKEEVTYIKDRLLVEANDFLISRYAHILYLKSLNNEYAKKAIASYLNLANEYLQLLPSKKKNIWDFISVVEAYVDLSLSIKVNLDECRLQVARWYEINLQEQFYYKCLLEIFATSKMFNRHYLIGYTNSALKHFDSTKCGFEAEDYLNTCLKIAIKEGVNLSLIYNLMAENQLLLAEKRDSDETGLIKADCYLKAAKYYKDAKELKKSNEVLRKLDIHKKNLKLNMVSTQLSGDELQEFFKSIKILAKHYLDAFPKTVFWGLAIDKRLLPTTNSYKTNSGNDFLNACRVSSFDININTHILNDFEQKRRNLFIFYKIGIEMTIPFLIKEIMTEMKEKGRDFVKEGLLYFNNTWFKSELQQTILSDEPERYNWMASLQPSIKILLNINNAKKEGTLTSTQQMAFDQLAIKFEGLLRDLCQLANITVTKVRDDQTVAMDVNDILQNTEIETVFEKVDIEFWQFVFTRCGYNIRNNVAHAFYRPHNYTVGLSNILLTAYIRLAKYGNIVLASVKSNRDTPNL